MLGGRLGGLRQEALLRADGAKLEVLSVHGDVRCQGLQIQLVKVSLEDTEQGQSSSAGGAASSQPLVPPLPPEAFLLHGLAAAKVLGAQERKTQMCLQSVEGLLTRATSLPVRLLPLSHSSTHPTGVSPTSSFLPTLMSTMAPGGQGQLCPHLQPVPRVYLWTARRVTEAQCSLWDLHSDQQGLRDGPQVPCMGTIGNSHKQMQQNERFTPHSGR